MEYGRLITSQTYYNGVVTKTVTEKEESVMSTRDGLLKDILDSLTVISSGETHRLNIEICVDDKGKYRLIRKWSV